MQRITRDRANSIGNSAGHFTSNNINNNNALLPPEDVIEIVALLKKHDAQLARRNLVPEKYFSKNSFNTPYSLIWDNQQLYAIERGEKFHPVPKGAHGAVKIAEQIYPATGKQFLLKTQPLPAFIKNNYSPAMLASWQQCVASEYNTLKHLGMAQSFIGQRCGKNGDVKQQFLMDKVAGYDLFNLIHLGEYKLSAHFVLSVAVSAIKEAIRLQNLLILHRDIKLENLIYNPSTKILTAVDFGSAVILNFAKQKVYSGFAGTKEFSAPELLEKKQVKYSFKTDIYSWGKALENILFPSKVNRHLAKDLKKFFQALKTGKMPFNKAYNKLLDLIDQYSTPPQNQVGYHNIADLNYVKQLLEKLTATNASAIITSIEAELFPSFFNDKTAKRLKKIIHSMTRTKPHKRADLNKCLTQLSHIANEYVLDIPDVKPAAEIDIDLTSESIDSAFIDHAALLNIDNIDLNRLPDIIEQLIEILNISHCLIYTTTHNLAKLKMACPLIEGCGIKLIDAMSSGSDEKLLEDIVAAIRQGQFANYNFSYIYHHSEELNFVNEIPQIPLYLDYLIPEPQRITQPNPAPESSESAAESIMNTTLPLETNAAESAHAIVPTASEQPVVRELLFPITPGFSRSRNRLFNASLASSSPLTTETPAKLTLS